MILQAHILCNISLRFTIMSSVIFDNLDLLGLISSNFNHICFVSIFLVDSDEIKRMKTLQDISANKIIRSTEKTLINFMELDDSD